MEEQMKKIKWMWVILISILLICILSVCAVGYFIFATGDFFGSNSVKTEDDVTFSQALRIFDLGEGITIADKYNYESQGWQDWTYRLSFDTDLASLSKIKETFGITPESANEYYALEAEMYKSADWRHSRCLDPKEAVENEIEVEQMHYAYLTYCQVGEDEYQIYLNGGTR